jgi:hypothetical protein
MEKSEVYSWRVDPRLKSALESAARATGTSMARLLDQIVEEWLRRDVDEKDQQEHHLRIQERAMRYIGSVRGGDPARASESSPRLKAILRKKHARAGTG